MARTASNRLRKRQSAWANYRSSSVYDSLSISDNLTLFSVTDLHGARFNAQIS